MSFIKFGEKSSHWTRERIVYHPNHPLHSESIVLEKLLEGLWCEDSHMDFSLARVPHSAFGVKRISQDHLVAHMGSERLFP